MYPFLKAVSILFCFIIIISCNNSPTDPELQPGRRDYVWTRDTLKADEFGFQFLSGIWGSSPNDVWVVGDAATYVNKVWHYNGVKWENYLLDQFATPIKIWGVSSSEIWMVTTISDIWKYDGTKWYKYTTIVPSGYKRILFEDIFGYSNNLYAVGIAEKTDGDYTGIIVHYNGSKWEILNTPQIKEYFNNIMFLKNGDVLISGQNYLEPQEPSRLYKLKDGNLSLIRKSSLGIFLQILNNKMYIGTDRKVYEYNNGSLKEVINLTGTDYLGSIWGRTIKDFFSANSNWNLGHYNGTDIVNVYPAEGYIINAQIFDKEVFIICHIVNSKYYVLHGILR
jgi:hypothetical protein